MESFRRKIIAAILAGLAACALLGSLRWPVSADLVKAPLEQALQRDTSYRLVRLEAAEVSAFPWPVLHLTGLELAKTGPSRETASAPVVKARLNVYSWFSGNPRITALTLFGPSIHLVSAENAEEAEALAAVVKNFLRQDRRPTLTSLKVQGGEATLDGARWLTDLHIAAGNIAGTGFRLTALGQYRGQALRLAAAAAPAAVNSRRPVTWELEAGDMSARFAGVLLSPPSLDAEGELSVALAAGALRSRPLSLPREAAALLDGVSVSGEAKIALPLVQFSQVTVARGSDRLRGAMELVLSQAQPRLNATLHSDSLDAGALTGPLMEALGGPGWQDARLGLAWLTGGIADLRLSARRAAFGALSIQDAAISAKLGGGRLELSVSEARVAGGAVKGRLSLMAQGDTLDMRATAQADQVDLAQIGLASALGGGGPAMLTGLMSGHASAETSGRSFAAMSRRADGRGTLSVKDGELVGFDADRFLRRADGAAQHLPDGRSRYQALSTVWRLAGGKMTLTEASIRAPSWRGRADGSADLGGDVDVMARLWLDGPEGGREERLINVSGPLLAPRATGAGVQQIRRGEPAEKKSRTDG